jgi:hypothetical protein
MKKLLTIISIPVFIGVLALARVLFEEWHWYWYGKIPTTRKV